MAFKVYQSSHGFVGPEQFSIDYRKTQTKVFTKANLNRGLRQHKLMGSQIKDRQTIKSARKTGRPSQDWFSSRGEFSRSVVGQSEAKPKQLRIIFRHSIEKDSIGTSNLT